MGRATAEGQAAYMREYYRSTPERRQKNRDRVKAWAKANPLRVRLNSIARKAKRRGVPMDAEAREYVLLLLQEPCAYCGTSVSGIDHIEPVFGGGDSHWSNLASACPDCNNSKSRYSLLHFMLRELHRR